MERASVDVERISDGPIRRKDRQGGPGAFSRGPTASGEKRRPGNWPGTQAIRGRPTGFCGSWATSTVRLSYGETTTGRRAFAPFPC